MNLDCPDKRNKIALFIPCFNEEERLQVGVLKNFIEGNRERIDFYFINDGSRDDTSKKIRENFVTNGTCILIDLENNLGKGNALRHAIFQIRNKNYSHFGFIDADLDISMEQVLKLQEKITSGNFLLAISKRELFSFSKVSGIRSIGSIGMVLLANRIIKFRPPIGDTQCGCKLFKMELLEVCFKEEFISEWLFDIELFLRLKKHYNQPREMIVEVPLHGVSKSGKSKFRILNNLRIFKQLYLINKHYR